MSRHFVYSFKVLILLVVKDGERGRGVKGQKMTKMTQDDKKLCISLHIPGTIPDMIVVFDTHV